MRKIFVFVVCLFISPCFPGKADAGVLLRSQRVRSSVRFTSPRVSLPRGRKSTVNARRLNPIRGGSLGGIESGLRMAKARSKYQKKLHRWEQKRARARQKLLRKRRRKEEARRKKLLKQEKARLKKLEKERRKKKKAHELRAGEKDVEVAEAPRKEGRESLLEGDQGKDGKGAKKRKKAWQPSFWSRLMKALVGT